MGHKLATKWVTRTLRLCAGLLVVFTELVWAPVGVRATAMDDAGAAAFYRGKTVTALVGYSPGGGFDQYTRLLARHIGRYIPGNPNVIVVNMPGAGSMVMTNHLYNVAARDGTVFGLVPAANLLMQVIRDPSVRFDASRFNWIGSMTQDNNVLIVRSDAPVRTFQDALRVPAKVGTNPPGALDYLLPTLSNSLLGTKFQVISGYPGTSDIAVALERDEVQGMVQFWSNLKSIRAGWLTGNPPFVNLLIQLGLQKPADLPQVPLIMDLARDEVSKQVLEAVSSLSVFARAFATAPGVPRERVAALREAFMQALQDPLLLEEAQTMNVSIANPLDGERVQRVVERLTHIPEDQADIIAQNLKK